MKIWYIFLCVYIHIHIHTYYIYIYIYLLHLGLAPEWRRAHNPLIRMTLHYLVLSAGREWILKITGLLLLLLLLLHGHDRRCRVGGPPPCDTPPLLPSPHPPISVSIRGSRRGRGCPSRRDRELATWLTIRFIGVNISDDCGHFDGAGHLVVSITAIRVNISDATCIRVNISDATCIRVNISDASCIRVNIGDASCIRVNISDATCTRAYLLQGWLSARRGGIRMASIRREIAQCACCGRPGLLESASALDPAIQFKVRCPGCDSIQGQVSRLRFTFLCSGLRCEVEGSGLHACGP